MTRRRWCGAWANGVRTASRTDRDRSCSAPSIGCRRCGRSSQRVVDQTRARLLGGDTHVPDKVLSLFEPHTETIRKGKIAKPNEFGKLVTIQESEHQIITAYEVHAKRPADVTLWTAGAGSASGRSSAARRIWPPAIAASARRQRTGGDDRGVRRVVLAAARPEVAGAARV